MGLLDNRAAFSAMNPNAKNIANEMATYMDSVSARQKQDYSKMFAVNPKNNTSEVSISPVISRISPTNETPYILRSVMQQGGK